MTKLDPFKEINLLGDVDGRIVKRLRLLYSFWIEEDPVIPEKNKQFTSSIKESAKKLLSMFVVKEKVDKVISKDIAHFHAIPEKYINREYELSDKAKIILKGMIRELSDYSKLVKELLEKSSQKKEPMLFYYTTEQDIARSRANDMKKKVDMSIAVINQILNTDLKEDEILENKLRNFTEERRDEIIRNLDKFMKVYLIQVGRSPKYGYVVATGGIWRKKIYFCPEERWSSFRVPSKRDPNIKEIEVANIFYIEKA